MKPTETQGKVQDSRSHSRRTRYAKVLDNRKHPIRGLWRRNGSYIARLTVEQPDGTKKTQWARLEASTDAGAHEELKKLHVEREENRLRHIGRAPKLADYIKQHCASLAVSTKRPATVAKEKGCLSRWSEKLGHMRLDQLRPFHVTGLIDELKREGMSGRTVNLYVIALRHVMKRARRDGYLKTLPTDDLGWEKSDTKKRALITPAEFGMICDAAVKASKNGQQFADYLKVMAYSGARRNEALALRWADVDFDRRQLTIGADGSSKNRKPRHVDFNPSLDAHLRDMHARRAPDSQWVFPSPQRGEKDIPTRTFKESLTLTRTVLPEKLKGFAFHDCRHHFVSACLMSGVPIMTVASWCGHQDGGILIGKVYGHLCDQHKQQQAQRVSFAPVVVEAPQQASGQ